MTTKLLTINKIEIYSICHINVVLCCFNMLNVDIISNQLLPSSPNKRSPNGAKNYFINSVLEMKKKGGGGAAERVQLGVIQ